jgi:thiol-disulfide isomerase/thioredoxin
MKLVFFVKDDCGACKNAKEKVDFFLKKWGAADSVGIETISVSTEDGLVEAAMREVADIPTVLLEDDGDEVARWTKRAPTSQELRGSLGL